MSFFRSVFGVFALALTAASAAAFAQPEYVKAPERARLGAAHMAKILCSGIFVSHRDREDIESWDLRYFRFPAKVDPSEQTVSVSPGFDLAPIVAVFRPGLGCTLALSYTLEHVRSQPKGVLARRSVSSVSSVSSPTELWPEGERVAAEEARRGGEVDLERLDLAVARAFAESEPGKTRRTRAVVVVHRGRIVAERYALGFDKDMPLIGWSMTKSLTNALVGILVREGKLDVDERAPVPEWQAKDDPRRHVKLDHLMRMTSGLAFTEKYDDLLTDTPYMLNGTPDAARFAAARRLEEDPGERFHYISGSPNIVCRVIREALGGSLADYFAFPRRELFDRIGMTSAVMEPDASGTFIGSSFSYATARDWARFGLLFLQDGVWNGERILPRGWVAYSTTPTKAAPRGEYGAYWWLNAGRDGAPEDRMFPSLPRDLYMALGFEGQNVIVIPSRELVIVRLGSSDPPTEGWDPERFVADVIGALER